LRQNFDDPQTDELGRDGIVTVIEPLDPAEIMPVLDNEDRVVSDGGGTAWLADVVPDWARQGAELPAELRASLNEGRILEDAWLLAELCEKVDVVRVLGTVGDPVTDPLDVGTIVDDG
jgi:hypothetical protein